MARRGILHSDLNCFYASVEMTLNPSLQDKEVAVCGSVEDRHGIVLAKSEKAKKAGVSTGMTYWEAKKKCPTLVCVPPQYHQYLKYSKLVQSIYRRYTDQVEPYGMDECWLDVTGSRGLFGAPLDIAQDIRAAVKREFGLTVSIGVSYNKVFAKLASDMKKPDAITVVQPEDVVGKVWTLPASDLLYVGPATKSKLARYGIVTIGDLAAADPLFLKRLLGVNGVALWRFANGQDCAPVQRQDTSVPIKSIGHGITCVEDLGDNDGVWRVLLALAQDVGHKLRLHGHSATGVQIAVKDRALSTRQYQCGLPLPTQSAMVLAKTGFELFQKEYGWQSPVRALSIRAVELVAEDAPVQLDFFSDAVLLERQNRLESAADGLRNRFGKNTLRPAVLLEDLKMPSADASQVVLPGLMYA